MAAQPKRRQGRWPRGATGVWEKPADSPQGAWGRDQRCPHLGFSPLRPLLEFCPGASEGMGWAVLRLLSCDHLSHQQSSTDSVPTAQRISGSSQDPSRKGGFVNKTSERVSGVTEGLLPALCRVTRVETPTGGSARSAGPAPQTDPGQSEASRGAGSRTGRGP